MTVELKLTAKSKSDGYGIYFDGTHWRFNKTGKMLTSKPCKQCGKENIIVELSHPRPNSNLIEAKVDACIAPLIKLLNKAGVKTTSCCCGHGKEGIIVYEQDDKTFELKINMEEIKNGN